MWLTVASTCACGPRLSPQHVEPAAGVESPQPVEESTPIQTEPAPAFVASAAATAPLELGVVHLEVPGFLPAVLLVPAGSEPRPLVAAAHGAGGSPEWECE